MIDVRKKISGIWKRIQGFEVRCRGVGLVCSRKDVMISRPAGQPGSSIAKTKTKRELNQF